MENFAEHKQGEKGLLLSKLLNPNITVNSLIINGMPQKPTERCGFKQICRLCANVVDRATSLFVDMDKGENLVDKINSCLPITVNENDALPKQLCTSCAEKLHECFQFSMSSISAEQKLMYPKSTTPTMNCPNTSSNTVNSRICNMNYKCPICVEGSLWLINKDNQETEKYEGTDDLKFNHSNIPSTCSENAECRAEVKRKSLIESEGEKYFTELNVTANPADEDIIHVLNNVNLSCRICNKLFHTAEVLNHCKFHASCNFYPCVLCDNIYFVNEAQIEIHLSSRHNMVSCNINLKEQIQEVNSQCEYMLKNNILPNKNFETGFVLNLEDNEKSSKVNLKICSDIGEDDMVYDSIIIPEYGKSCEICGKHFESDALMTLHVNSEHIMDNGSQCKECDQYFETSKFLEEHKQNEHVPGKSFQYEYCGVNFNEQTQAKKTKKYLNSENSDPQVCYFCSECKAVFPDPNEISEHGSMHQQYTVSTDYVYDVYKCEYCDLSFINTDNLKSHVAQHIGDLPYMCLLCNLHFESYYKVMEHKKNHTLNKNIPSPILFSIPIHYLCEFCGKSFRQWEYLYIHRYKSHLNGRTSCTDENSKPQGENLPFSNHNSQTQLLCDICGKTFESQALLTKHRKQEHPQISKYQCTECGKVLANLTGLVIHRRLHTGEKPFVCDVCGKSFHQSSGMYTHRRTHTRECPYRCEYCGQAYNVKGDLDNHRRAKHTKERPFKCETCQKSFLTSSVFYQHRILHTGVRKYKCMHCDKSFARWNALRLHIRTHTGEKPYVCHVCQRGFAQKGDMKKHMKTQHNILDVPQTL